MFGHCNRSKSICFRFLTCLVGILISLFINKSSISIKGRGANISQTEVDTLNITASNEKYLFDALSIATSSFNTYTIKTISASNDIECLATVGINVKSDEDLRNLIQKITNSPGIINVTFYNNSV